MAIAAVDTKYGPASGAAMASGSCARSRPEGASQVRDVIPENVAAAPSSARTT